MTEFQDIPIFDQAPPPTEKIHNVFAAFRGKENRLRPADSEGNFTALFSKNVVRPEGSAGKNRDTIAGLKREYDILQELSGSGVTPIPLACTVNETQTEANLLMRGVPGKSVEQMGVTPDVQARFTEMMYSILSSLDVVHKNGIAVRDVNFGTFVVNGIDRSDQAITSAVVDFEVAVREEELAQPAVIDSLSYWYKTRDMGYARMLQAHESVTPEHIYKSERYLAVLSVLEHFIGTQVLRIDYSLFSAEQQAEIKVEQARLRTELEAITREQIMEDWEDQRQRGS